MLTHEKGTRSTTRNVLKLKEVLALQKVVVEEYVASGLVNSAFASMVNEKHKVSEYPITASHVVTMLDALGIENNFDRSRSKSSSAECHTLAARVAAVEEQLAKLVAYVKHLPPTSGK
jgi:hypothetical protein